MSRHSKRLVHGLAALERRVRERLDRAANRMEDHDSIDVVGLLSTVKLLNLIDRITAYRATHREATASRFAALPRPPNPPEARPRPELGELTNLTAADRGRLKAKYQIWNRHLSNFASTVKTDSAPDGGHTLTPDQLEVLRPLWESWRSELKRVAAETDGRTTLTS